ncbi:MAG: threonine synthase, partial [Candidatus Aenigmarchaeota archaeon]|nr:threonine synthase [Candidatus Aenigmarchaeota archaeon]
MDQIMYYSTNNKDEKVDFQTALLNGLASNYGLYMMDKKDIPKLDKEKIKSMKDMSYSQIAFEVIYPFLEKEIKEEKFREIIGEVYDSEKITVKMEHVVGRANIMWLTHGPTYSFKDYAARFFGKILDYFLEIKKIKKVVVVATSGDTGGAVADALKGLDNVSNIVFFPKGSISSNQRRQMTTLKNNIYAFEVNGDFDVCQAMVKKILGDKKTAKDILDNEDIFTSANSISVARLLPQIVFPFFAYSRTSQNDESMIASIPCGNFGDMMGTIVAKNIGLPVSKILCGVNENREFPDFLETGKYIVSPSKKSPSSAMIVAHPSNFARLVDIYGGHVYDERDPVTKKVIRNGVMDLMPDIEAMNKDIFSCSISNQEHYDTMKRVYDKYNIMLDPHGAV